MAKALKTAALVVGAAALVVTGVGVAAGLSIATALSFGVAGVSAATMFTVAGGLSMAAAALTKAPQVPKSQTDRLYATIDPRAFRTTVLGSTALATDVRYEEWSGTNQDYCDWIVCVASHKIEGVDEIWLNDELAWSTGSGVQSKYSGYFSVEAIVLEGTPANATTFASGKWNSAHRLTGCAYLHLRFKVTGNGKKAESPFSSGPPSRMTIIGRGGMVYDPRRTEMRADDQSTWRFASGGEEIGSNLPLQILRVMMGWRITNPATGEKRLAVGMGIPPKRLHMASFAFCANLAAEMANRSTGGLEPRYYGGGVISEGEDPSRTLDAMLAACNGRIIEINGQLGLSIAHNDLASAATDPGLFTQDVVGPFEWDPDPALEETPTVVRGQYVDTSTNSLYQLIDYPEVRLPSSFGIDRVLKLDLGWVESASHAQRIAKQALARKHNERIFSAPFDIRAWAWPVGSLVPFTFGPLGFDRALFRVIEQEPGKNNQCNMRLRLETAATYAWDKDDSPPVVAAAVIRYDPLKDPLIQAIGVVGEAADKAAERGARTVVERSAWTLSSTANTITVGPFDAVLDTGEVRSFAGRTITNLQPATLYQVFYNDQDTGYYAVPVPTLTTVADARHVLLGSQLTQASDGTYPQPESPPAGYGGGSYPRTYKKTPREGGVYQEP